MSADLLRQAATDIREASPTGTYGDPCGECGQTGAFLDAVADWLADAARAWDDSVHDLRVRNEHHAFALAVARAYLGEGS